MSEPKAIWCGYRPVQIVGAGNAPAQAFAP